MFKVLADRAYGKVRQQVELGFDGGVGALSDADLNAHIAELKEELGFFFCDQSDMACLSDHEVETLKTIHGKMRNGGLTKSG